MISNTLKNCLAVLCVLISLSVNAQINFNPGSKFSYLKGNNASNLSSNWTNAEFNDSQWRTANAPFRYGDGAGGTLLNDMQGNYSTLFLRSSFSASNINQLGKVSIGVNWDDGFVLWINGNKVQQQQAPAQIASNALASDNHESGSFEYFSFNADDLNLFEGENTIAVLACNVTLDGSSDFYFDMNISAKIDLADLPIYDDTLGVVFSHDAGFYDQVFELTLESALSDVDLIYTIDGSNPQTSATAQTVSSPLTITIDPDNTNLRSKTPSVIIRASVVKEGFKPSFPESRTFIFLDKVFIQKNPGGSWPAENLSNRNKQYIDYAMDSDVINSMYKSEMVEVMKSIPSLCISTDNENLFDTESGIYVNAYGQGKEWERDCSVELINPDGSEGFNINGGLRIRGGWSRHDYFPKHALRLFFRDEYGKGKLKYPLFDDEGVDEFDKVDLRCANNYSWANVSSSTHNTFVREVFTRDSQGELGRPYTRSRYYHLYLNGMYWGMYQTQERSEARFAESYFGGDKEEYDVVKISGEDYSKEIAATDGTLDKWEEIYNLTRKGFKTNVRYYYLEGKDENGNVIPHAEVFVDIDNLIDFMINIIYTGNYDSPVSAWGGNKKPNNFYAITNREDKSFGFKFFVHDGEHVLMTVPSAGPGIGIQENRANIGYRNGDDKMIVTSFSMFHSQWLHHKLSENAEYRMRFADRAQAQLTRGGIFTPEACETRFDKRVKQIEKAIIGESARWGDTHTSVPYTKEKHWEPEINEVKNNYFPYRTNIVIKQLQDVHLYPTVDAPVIKYMDNEVLGMSQVMFASRKVQLLNQGSNGAMYYTLDGTDPRDINDGLNDAAIRANKTEEITLSSSAIVKARIYGNGEWSALTEVSFLCEQNNFDALKITEIHYHPTDSIIDTDTINDKNYEFIEFKNTSTSEWINLTGVEIDSAIQYTFPDNFLLAPQQYFVAAAKPAKFYDRYGLIASGNYQKNLGNGGERIWITDADGDIIFDFEYSDDYPWEQLADGKGYSLESVSANPEGNPADADYWMASGKIHGTPFGHSTIKTSVDRCLDDLSTETLIYPNPATNMLNIDLSEITNQINVSIFGVDGRLVVNNRFKQTDFITLDVANLQQGMYIIKLKTENGILNSTFMKQD